MIHQYTRREMNADPGTAVELLSLVRLDSDASLAIQIETYHRDPNGRALVGLYDLDGDQIALGNESWELVTETEITGREAIEIATKYNLTLRSHTTPIDDARDDISVDAAEELLSADPGLVYVKIEDIFSAWETGTSIVERWTQTTAAA